MLELIKEQECSNTHDYTGNRAVTALTYTTEIFDPKRFIKSKSVGAYLSMTPTQYQSGEVQK